MPYNGSGTYSRPAGQPVVAGTDILDTTFNTYTADVATALTNCVTRDGQSPATANIPLGGNKLTGLAAATVAGDAVRYEQVAAVNDAALHAAAGKTTPVDADEVHILDSAAAFAGKTSTWTNIKAFFKTYFDTIYTTTAAVASQITAYGYATLASPTFTGVPAAPTAVSGTSTTQIATTAFSVGVLSGIANGYQKFPSGLIIQWGTFTSAGGVATITYPLAFPSAVFSLIASPITTGNPWADCDRTSLSQGTIKTWNTAGAIASSGTWIAVGV